MMEILTVVLITALALITAGTILLFSMFALVWVFESAEERKLKRWMDDD